MDYPQLTYEKYGELGGGNSEEGFNASLRTAYAKVREIIGFNMPDETNEEAYLRAVCAAVDVDIYYGSTGGIGEGLSSISIGSFSASIGVADTSSSYDSDMRNKIRRELVGSGLLYQGIG